MSLAGDLYNILLPDLCVACGTPLVEMERVICLRCLYDLPRTRFESYQDNPVARLFWGRVPVEHASAYFLYRKGSRFRTLIQALKYGGRTDIGREIGRLMGLELMDTAFSGTDLILPVPLHRSRRLRRGYNQCDPVCEGLSQVLGIPYHTQLLERPLRSVTQTGKSRYARWTNVEGIFRARDPERLAGRHLLLVDDVVTTGSTLEACAEAILKIPGTRVSIAALAVAPKVF